MRTRTASLSLFGIILFLISGLTIPTVPLASTEVADGSVRNPVNYGPESLAIPADYPNDYTHVQWEQGTNTEQFDDSHSWSNWMFGPTITWSVRNATTDNLITVNDKIGLDDWANYILKVPKEALSGKLPYIISFMGTYFNLTDVAHGAFEPQPFETAFIALYVVPENRWEIYSSKNATFTQQPPPGELPANWTLDGLFGAEFEPFLEINVQESGYVIGPENIWVQFQLKFDTASTLGAYRFSAAAMDNHLMMLAESHGDEETSSRVVGLTLHQTVAADLGGYYTLERVDDGGNPVYSATRGDDFNIS
ncbi:MAG: hypothetical protein RTU30_07950, partial [Candidatus Thorarchaeota archaeon]